MTIINFRAVEPLYLVIVRTKDAEQQLRAWAKSSGAQVTIESNRMKIFEQRSLSLFQIQWTGDWDSVSVWDCWNKRHLDSN